MHALRLEPTNCLCAALRKASRAVTQLYDLELRASGIRSTQFNILSAIQTAGEANLAQLTGWLLLDQTTLTRSLGLLEEMQLLEQVPARDQRLKVVKLTPRGTEVLRSATVLWRKAQRKIVKALGDEQVAATQNQLQALALIAQDHK